MKKISFFVAIAAAASLASCTAQAPKANMKNDVDSLSYMMGITNTQGLDMYMSHQLGVDTAYMADFIRGVKEGTSKTSPKDVAYMAGLQIGQQVGGRMFDMMSQRIFGNDSTQSLSKENFLAGFMAALQKKGMNVTMEEANAYAQLMDMFHLTQEEVAKRVGKSRSAVANSLRLLKLPEDVKTLVEDGGLSAGHARALLGISDEKLLSETAAKAADGKLTVRAVEKIAADSEKPEKRTKFSHKDSFYKEIEISLESRLGRRVTVTAGKNKGTLNLEFYDKDDLSALAQKLTKE